MAVWISRREGPMACGPNAGRMQVARVEYTPQQEVYHPGDVLNVAIALSRPFVGQCEAGLAPGARPLPDDVGYAIFARSNAALYEGQVHVRPDHVGACKLVARLSPVRGEPQTLTVTECVFNVQPVRP